jgi:hypothetical protein
VILTNTHSLYSVVTHAKGINSADAFLHQALSAIRTELCDSGRAFAWERHLAPGTGTVQFATLGNRSVMGSINEFVFAARMFLVEGQLSPIEVAAKINETPMSYLWKRGPAVCPADAFDLMVRDQAGG